MSKVKYLVLGAGIAFTAFANNAEAADGKALYTAKMCQTCHGAEGKAPIMDAYPKINGQNKTYLLNQMKDIKSGARANGMLGRFNLYAYVCAFTGYRLLLGECIWFEFC